MAQGNIKIINTQDNETKIMFDGKTEIQIKNNKYYFTIDNFSQELLVEDNSLKIIRPEMTINLVLDEIIESIYPTQGQEIKMKFKLNTLKRKNNDLDFSYSLISTDNEVVNNIEVLINF